MGDLLTAYDGVAISYDTIGNPLSDGTWTYTWQQGRQLASMTSGDTIWQYTYDANGTRTRRSNGNATYTYVYNGDRLTQMHVANNKLFFTYSVTGAPATVTWNGVCYYYITNLQGDVLLILDQNSRIAVSYHYDAWGNILMVGGEKATTLGTLNPLTYRGYVYDRETGLYYLQSRYYNPTWGRFINADELVSTGQGLLSSNMFAYCNNNPVKNVDRLGHFGICVLDDTMNVYRSYMTPGMFGGGGGSVAGVSSSYYAQQNIRAHDNWWRNSCYNPNMTWSNGATVQANAATVPQHAWDTLNHIKGHNGSPPNGYKGGKLFANDGRNGEERLPNNYGPFREYDVHPKVAGQDRGAERIVVGNGAVWYTSNHYYTFTRLE